MNKRNRNLTRPAAIFAIVCAGLLAGCVDREPKPEPKYTIWVGNSIVSLGHGVDSYVQEDGWITWTNSKGIEKRAPIEQIVGIDTNF